MKKQLDIKVDSVHFKNNIKAKEDFIKIIINHVLDQDILKKED